MSRGGFNGVGYRMDVTGGVLGWMWAFGAKHGPVIVGLLIGTVAKYGRMLSTGQRFTCRQVIGHLMMMAMVGLVATVIVDVAGLDDPNVRAFTAAVLAVAASDVVKYLATRAWQRFLQDPADARGALRQELQVAISAERLMDDAQGKDGQ